MAVYVGIMVIVMAFVLEAALQLGLAATQLGTAWDFRRQREVEARAVAVAVKEAILAVSETAPSNASDGLPAEVASKVGSIVNGTTGVTITGSPANASVLPPSNPQWPGASPVGVAMPNFATLASVGPIGRNLQSILSAGPIADLGTKTFSFTQTSTLTSETPNYIVTARMFSVPVTNFNWVAYGLPATTNGVVNTPPTSPSGTWFAMPSPGNSGLAAPLVHAYSGETGTFPEMFGGSGSALPSYQYRDLVSVCWNTFEYWTSLNYQNALLVAATAVNTFDYTNPTNLPSGVTWDGTTATLDLGATTATAIVFVDSLGGNTLKIVGAPDDSQAPVIVAIRNFSGVQTNVQLQGTNSRSTILYLPCTALTPLAAGINFRGAVLLFTDSTTPSINTIAVTGLVGYPQMWSNPPNLTAGPDSGAINVQADLAPYAPRILLVSSRASVQ